MARLQRHPTYNALFQSFPYASPRKGYSNFSKQAPSNLEAALRRQEVTAVRDYFSTEKLTTRRCYFSLAGCKHRLPTRQHGVRNLNTVYGVWRDEQLPVL